jgi:outer membrane protein OmpA-like peptidoglycan-associated protein
MEEAVMNTRRSGAFAAVILILCAATAAVAMEVTLYQVTFPERRGVDLEFARTLRAPSATLRADVRHREGQAEVTVRFRDMKPAVLFGGDVTSYVLWAVARDGSHENLGELWVRSSDDKVDFATGLKAFALMVTAEPFPLVSKPSELVLFTSLASSDKRSPSSSFQFSDFAPRPFIGMESIAEIAWDSRSPLDLKQAEKAFELAEREGADSYAPQIYREAKVALNQARAYGEHTTRTKRILDFSRRAVSLASEAIQIAIHRKEAEELERQIAARRREMEGLEERARAAEETAAAAREQLDQAHSALEEARLQKDAADAAILEAQGQLGTVQGELGTAQEQLVVLQQERATLEAERQGLLEQQAALNASVAELTARAERLRQEREQLSSRLQDALSQVADTQESARGLIVNLPDILFDVDQATLKPGAKVVLGKLSGILLMMSELNLRIEGHTDSTGSDEHNQRLSERRAGSVKDFLAREGIGMNRMVAAGYGEDRPVADNDSADGRKKNRRVEIIIAEGVVQEAK